MARYITAEPPDVIVIAKLELDGWSTPEYWRGEGGVPEDWPMAAVDGLIYLFTGKRTIEIGPEGTEIPDILGWHIATLIEAWGSHLYGIGSRPLDGDFRRLYQVLEDECPEHIISQTARREIAEKNFDMIQLQRTRFLERYVQQWYSNGLTLYNTHLRREWGNP